MGRAEQLKNRASAVSKAKRDLEASQNLIRKAEQTAIIDDAVWRGKEYAPRFVDRIVEAAGVVADTHGATQLELNFAELNRGEDLPMTPANLIYVTALGESIIEILKREGFKFGMYPRVGTYFRNGDTAGPLYVGLFATVSWGSPDRSEVVEVWPLL